MTTLDQLTSSLQERREAAQRRKAAAESQVEGILDAVHQRGADRLTGGESGRVNVLIGDRDSARRELAELDAQMAEARTAAAQEAEFTRRTGQVRSTGLPRPDFGRAGTAALHVGREARTYRPDTDPRGHAFVLDVCRDFLFRDPRASERLARHSREEEIERPGWSERAAGDTTTGNWAGLVVPQYLVDLFAPSTTPMRPFADLCCPTVDLPPLGMSVNFSKLTTGTSVALQATELGVVSATTADDTLGTANVQTAAGSQNVSRQAIERGTGIDQAIMGDLFRKYATALDSTLLTQATTGLTNIAQNTAFTSASPTIALLWPLLFMSQSLLEQALQGVAFPTHVVMHSRRWNWIASTLGTTWPFIGFEGTPGPVQAQSAGYQLTTEYGPNIRAVLANGVKVVVDNNVPVNLGVGTNQDEIYTVAANESLWLAEAPDAPVLLRAEQATAPQLGVLLVCYGYFAYFNRYANSAGKISGTGLTPQAGF